MGDRRCFPQVEDRMHQLVHENNQIATAGAGWNIHLAETQSVALSASLSTANLTAPSFHL